MFGGLEPLLTPIDPLAKLTNRKIPHIRKDVLHILIYQSKKKNQTCISFGKVALNSVVCLTPAGGMSICSTIILIFGSKPIFTLHCFKISHALFRKL
jgi:hypothetical protein